MTAQTDTRLAVVAVHGVGHYDRHSTPDAVRHASAETWATHLAAGLSVSDTRFNVHFAYYAPLLHRGPVPQGAGATDELHDPLARQLMSDWLEELQAPRPVQQGALTLPLRHVAAWVAEKFSLDGRLTQLFIQAFFHDVAAYLRSDDDSARQAVRGEVAAQIAQHHPSVVIAHSLGSVVAYEALHAHPELTVDLLLTLGSPLALPRAVFDRLLPRPVDGLSGYRGVCPPNVSRWVNIADPGDPIAIPPRLQRAFDGIALDHTDTIHAFGFHRAKYYLSCAATAATLGPYLGM